MGTDEFTRLFPPQKLSRGTPCKPSLQQRPSALHTCHEVRMRLPQYCVRFQPKVSEEILRLAKANGVTATQMIQELVREAIIARAEELTDSQFQYVEQRLKRIEERFAGWMIKLSKAISLVLFYVEQLALYEVPEKDQRALKRAAERFMSDFLQIKTSRHLKDDPEHSEQD